MRIPLRLLALLSLGLPATVPAQAGEIVRTPIPGSDFPIAAAVTVPPDATLTYLSGALPAVAKPDAPKGSVESYGDTEAQTLSVLSRLEAGLKAQGLGFGDVVQAHVYLVGDPGKGGEIDFAGLQKAWSRYFGTPAQPNKPARSTVKVAGLVAPGTLVEIEFVAAKVKK